MHTKANLVNYFGLDPLPQENQDQVLRHFFQFLLLKMMADLAERFEIRPNQVDFEKPESLIEQYLAQFGRDRYEIFFSQCLAEFKSNLTGNNHGGE